ncbi:transposase [Pseudovibrio sp. Tun.PSC04-5.I4]|uniref:transposase n=1 Tax=Pseudovibrio sp. Tun.PSC04-5.I4 TaxID=1798213 RepID=UPI000887449D|nr:transposase [Pseudovibrio sp. Tun.PSC04-5.I4]SDQ97736.1 transposase [Pseudovibrio sp. Tun.PSC04-5.I4]
MSKNGGGSGPRYSDTFKMQLVAESLNAGTTVPMVSKRHGVLASRIYAWRQDERFRDGSLDPSGFAVVEVTDAPTLEDIPFPLSEARIEIILENGRRLSISDRVDAGFVVELARGLAA